MDNLQIDALLSTRNLPNDVLVDDPERLYKKETLWKQIINFRENRQLDKKINEEVVSYFQTRYHIDDTSAFKRIWRVLGTEIWTPSRPLTASALRSIDQAIHDRLFYHGKGIEGPKIEGNSLRARVHRFVRALIHGYEFPSELLAKETAKSIFIKHDKELMDLFRESLQAELAHLAENPPQNEKEVFIWNAFIGNIIALLPFSYPEKGALFSIPRFVDGKCILEPYKIEPIPLYYPDVDSPMMALGMTPENDQSAPNMLVFMGTTFPGGSGFAATIFSDFTPGHSVGEVTHDYNVANIDKWLAGKSNITAIGLSLGGALVFHALRNHPGIFSRAEVFSPPGLNPEDWKKPVSDNCHVNIYTQKGDIVTQLGAFPTGPNISLYSIIPHHEGIKENPLHAHLKVFSGCRKITVLKQDPASVNASFGRMLLTKWHQYIAPFMVFLPFGLSYFALKFFKKVKKVVGQALNKI